MTARPERTGWPTFDRFAGRRPPANVEVAWCPECGRSSWPAPRRHWRHKLRCRGEVMVLSYTLNADW